MKRLLIIITSLVLLSGCNVTQSGEHTGKHDAHIETRSSSNYPGCHRYGTVYNAVDLDSVTQKVSSVCNHCTRNEYHLTTAYSITLLWKCVEPGCGTRYSTRSERSSRCRDLPDDGFHVEMYPATWLDCNNKECTRYGLTHDVRVMTGARQSRKVSYASGNCRRCYRSGDHQIRCHEVQNITKCSACNGMRLTTPSRVYDRCFDE